MKPNVYHDSFGFATLSAAAPAATPAQPAAASGTQQDKMKTCNADAASKALKGEERKTCMKACLKD